MYHLALHLACLFLKKVCPVENNSNKLSVYTWQDVAATAALELVECFGQFDPAMSSQFLALFQVNIVVKIIL